MHELRATTTEDGLERMTASLVDVRSGVRYPLCAPLTTIGRSAPAQVAIEDPFVSREHAQVLIHEPDVWFVDLESANGSWINQRPVAGPHRLEPGDVVRLGSTELRFELRGRGPAACEEPHV